MTTPPDDGTDAPEADSTAPAVEEPDFDPYRFGAPEHPVPPEYAPPGYRPPPVTQAPVPGQYTTGQYPAYPPPTYGSAGYPPAYPPAYPPGGYPGQQYPYQPPPFHGYPQPSTGNGKSIAALVLGICSIVFFWTAFFDLLIIIPAIVFGSMGLAESRRRPGAGGSTMAKVGLACTAVGVVCAVAFTVFAVNRLNHCDDLYGSGSHQYNQCIRDGS
jgi:hypothetical protein